MSNLSQLETKLVHAGRKSRYTQGSVNPVVQRASSLVFESVSQKKHATRNRYKGELFYGRRGTLTHFALQDAMCELESGAGCYLYPCGAAAVTNSILAFVSQGDHVLMTGAAYEPTQDFCNVILKNIGVSTTYYDPLIGEGIRALIRPNTKVLFLESPSSLTMEVPDIPTLVRIAREVNPNMVIMIDNTWAGGVLFPALEFGIDISIQAGTKYLVGHSDVMIGTAVSNARCWDQLREHSYLMGQMVDADSAYTTARGLRTLGIRLKEHQERSIQVAQWLAQRPEVKAVFHPALPSCPGHEFFKRDFKGASGLFSFELNQKLNDEQLANFLDHFELFTMAYSWGGFESLILANQPEEIARIRPAIERKLSGTLIRIHVGLEAVEDLIADLEKSFSRLK
ncbi:cystathionine beta-lyase [Actinobacillus pleuropneumoniae]|uniref:cysteine-S-conjugate beta-lyase n=4 Tax=Actinobacillus pleuropneumoniae TaxID=715 RepID=A3MZ38_ACTP2|nr:cystathionine beta-lyase [Actinobacillus pleuropneumoniae]ABN73424.1 cystathionine beta-lyase [Actinobacillus pleuropneumoniae serovar 5b str. L20]ACE60977.1 cystathionine beta-lyase [Actinobacillus pleuropneumoniae serovar 7 str. AP76]EFL81743.1 cystathionine beta-lyase [Actinobacillus pleuropneumoniae serovar 6 str. Femo]EFM92558.1 Cystathionine beta-lyase [Actinobacillus pleuropneumoniae serovar 6 str. Femo]MEE3682135.1 cystathionine beta-lyase [Actinobacillus pleuropneumoniae]